MDMMFAVSSMERTREEKSTLSYKRNMIKGEGGGKKRGNKGKSLYSYILKCKLSSLKFIIYLVRSDFLLGNKYLDMTNLDLVA